MKCPHCNRGISTTFLKKWNEILELMSDHRAPKQKIDKAIAGALRQTIDAHGPITKPWIGSAAKRVYTVLRNYRRQINRDERDRQAAHQ